MYVRKNQKTKIIATVGPACNSYENIIALIHAGVDVFRLNFSHGKHEDHANVIEIINKINDQYPFNIAILADLQGPKLRIGEVENNGVQLIENEIITFTTQKCLGTKERVYLSYPNFHNDVKVGEKILIDDGKIEVRISAIHDNHDVSAVVTTPGILSSKKGINLPETKISLPALTEKDLLDIDFIINQNIDWVALSFVRKPDDIQGLRKILKEKGSNAKIIAKIEKPEALLHLREIILASDAIMVARGDLGVELPVEQIPMIQKNIIRKCIHRAKPVIIATQMMESMIDRVKPNRSEITDVANAVLEGADAVMLSGETAVGNHPSLVVETMSKIIGEVEKEEIVYNKNLIPQQHSPSFLSDALCYNACKIADDVNANAIIGMTQSGYTGFMLSSFRPKSPLYIFTKTQSLVNQLSLSWGVQAFYYNKEVSLDEIIHDQIEIIKMKNLLKTDDVVINTGSTPVHDHLPTNTIKISKVK
ncbi:MAG: pyruvate kinase [Bacteroidetes bacterium]|jgi:pyruvate kinase|nr:pyruvate kinase [Bacteroidota bacterium]MBK6820028.1 pyruvate kinase [Bacteroidota bacterium]MBK7041518.1 pyruvate kinase [Bacteroidota bacterium]MBK7588045.1 pyruvate kinase [Bacteroidota bacterium]MBK9301882.1 pyruvate kinase [Bacteroidota bacterium]